MSKVDEVLNAPDVRYFPKHIIRLALQKDPVDAIEDLELALEVIKENSGVK